MPVFKLLPILSDRLWSPAADGLDVLLQDGDSGASAGGGSDLSSILGISSSSGGGGGGGGSGNQLNEKLRILTDGVSLLLRVGTAHNSINSELVTRHKSSGRCRHDAM